MNTKQTLYAITAGIIILGTGTSTLYTTNIFANEGSLYHYDANDTSNSFYEISKLASKSRFIVDKANINKIKTISLKNLEIIDKKVSFEDLDIDNIRIMKTRGDDNKTYISVNIPVKNLNILSSLTLFYDEKLNFKGNFETLVDENEKGNFKIEQYMNGSLYNKINTSVKYISVEKFNDEINNIKLKIYSPVNSGSSFKSWKTVGCIAAVLGVNYGVATVIAGVCSASCPAIVPICVACVSGVFALAGADINGLVKCFEL